MNFRNAVSAVVLFFLFAACSDNNPQEQGRLKMTAILDTIIQDWEGQEEFINEFNGLTNSDLTIIQPPHQQYNDKLLVSITTNDIPDLFECLPEYLSLYISGNIALDITDYINKSENLKSVDPEYLESVRFTDGRIYGFPARDGGGCVTYIRKDWLDNLGLEIPGTWEQMYQVMRAFTFNDPDGNGQNDTFGYTDVAAGTYDWYNRVFMLDARMEIYFKDGHWIDGFSQDSVIPALERLKLLADEGLIDPDFFTNTTFAARTRFFNGDAGIFTYWGNHWARNIQDRTEITSSAGENPVEVIALPPVSGGFYIRRVGPVLVISTSSANPSEVFRRFIDLQYDKGPVQTLFTYGVENYHWEISDGQIKFRVNPNDPYSAEFTKAYVPPSAIINNWQKPSADDPLITPALEILDRYSVKDRIMFGGQYFNNYYQEIERTLKPEIVMKIISGEVTINEGMELYRQKSSRLYLDKILDELNMSVN